MSYRRRYSGLSYSSNRNYGQPIKVSIHWSMKASAYMIKFSDIFHYKEAKIFMEYIKSKPYGEYQYDPDNKIWYLTEKYIDGLKSMIEMLPQLFTVDFQEKQVQNFVGTFVSVDTYLDKFSTLSGSDLRGLEYNKAKKIYRRVCMLNHPDRGGDSQKMSEINECWSNIEKLYFNQKKEPEYVTV